MEDIYSGLFRPRRIILRLGIADFLASHPPDLASREGVQYRGALAGLEDEKRRLIRSTRRVDIPADPLTGVGSVRGAKNFNDKLAHPPLRRLRQVKRATHLYVDVFCLRVSLRGESRLNEAISLVRIFKSGGGIFG